MSKEVLAARKKIKEDSKRAKAEAAAAQKASWKEQQLKNKNAMGCSKGLSTFHFQHN